MLILFTFFFSHPLFGTYLWNLTKNLGSRVGTFAFFCTVERDKGSVCLCTSHLGIEIAWLKPWKRAVFNRGKYLFSYLYKNNISQYSFHYKLMEHLTLSGLCGLLIISTCFSSENQALEGGKDLIWPNFGAPWWVPPSGLTLIDA